MRQPPKQGQELVSQRKGADRLKRLGPSCPSQTSSCLKIVTVSRRKRFVRILNESQEETADLGGFTLQQLSCHSPVRMYRFPPHTLLAPRHHITVRPRSPQALAPPPLTRPSPSSGVVPRYGARGLTAARNSRRRPWPRSLSTSTPTGAA